MDSLLVLFLLLGWVIVFAIGLGVSQVDKKAAQYFYMVGGMWALMAFVVGVGYVVYS